MAIHKEGYKILIITFLILLAINTALVFLCKSWLVPILSASVAFVLFMFIMWFFRSPKRESFFHEKSVLSPADGKIVVIEETEEPEVLKGKCIQVSIFMSVLNVHINWFPIDGVVSYFRHHSGRFMGAYLPKSSTENERTTVQIISENGQPIVVRQVAGALARRIVSYAEENNKAEQGKQMGFIKFGSRVDLYLPLDTRIDVKIGQEVRGKQTIIGWMK